MRILPVALRFHSVSPDTVSSIAMQLSLPT